MHRRDQDFARPATLEQKRLDARIVEEYLHELIEDLPRYSTFNDGRHGSPGFWPLQLEYSRVETRRTWGSFKWELPVLAEAIASRLCRQQEMPLPKSNQAYFLSPYRLTPSLRRNVIIGHQLVNAD
jgi:hypothetical protein